MKRLLTAAAALAIGVAIALSVRAPATGAESPGRVLYCGTFGSSFRIDCVAGPDGGVAVQRTDAEGEPWGGILELRRFRVTERQVNGGTDTNFTARGRGATFTASFFTLGDGSESFEGMQLKLAGDPLGFFVPANGWSPCIKVRRQTYRGGSVGRATHDGVDLAIFQPSVVSGCR